MRSSSAQHLSSRSRHAVVSTTDRGRRTDPRDAAITEVIPLDQHVDRNGFDFGYNRAFDTGAAVFLAPELDDLRDAEEPLTLPAETPSEVPADFYAGRHYTPDYDRRGRLLRYLRSHLRTLSAVQWALAGSGWITLLGVEHLPPGSPPRALLVFFFILFCPGFAVAALVPTREAVERWVLAVALSMSFGLLVSVACTVMRDGSVTHRLVPLALITTIAVLIDAVVPRRKHTSVAPTGEEAQR